MAYTQLSLTGTPGKRYSFLPKDEAAPEAGPHTGTFTELSVTGTPGKIHSFLAKTEAAPEAGPHTGLFTWLSMIATPGRRLSFLAKSEAVVEEPKPSTEAAGGAHTKHRKYIDKIREAQIRQIHKEDEEILQVLMQAVLSEIL